MAGKETKAMTATDPAKSGEVLDSTFKALSVPASKLALTLTNNLGNVQLRPLDLDRVKVPTGGGQSWEVPALSGVETVKQIEGIVIYFKDMRSYWSKPYGGGGGAVPPDCSSSDLIQGIGSPGGLCMKCPFAQFGTAKKPDGTDGRGQACKHVRMLFVLREQDMIPVVVVVPPSSVKLSQKYFLRLAGAGMPYQQVVTRLGLIKATSADNVPYSQIDFAAGRFLNNAEVEKVHTVAAALREVFEKATVIDTDVTGAE